MYIGNKPATDQTYLSLKSQQITGTGTATYSLDYDVAVPEDLAVFVNEIRQNPNTYSVDNQEITLGGTISASDTCYIVYLARSVGTVSPPDNSVGTSKIVDGAVTSAKLSGVTQGITQADMWRLTTNLTITGDATNDITANLERVDTNNFSKIGTGMTESSGIFTFPETGIYEVSATGTVYGGLDINYFHFDISTTTDNSTYTSSQATNNHTHNGKFGQATGLIIFDVTNTSTHKVKFRIYHSSSGTVQGSTTKMATFFKFIRLGDT